jgi:hypothetical protein
MGMVVALKVSKPSIFFIIFSTVATTQELLSNIQSQIEESQQALLLIADQIAQQTAQQTEEAQEEESNDSLDCDLVALITDVTDVRIDRMTNEYQLRIKDVERVNVAFEIILADYFTDEEVNHIMGRLNFCRRINDFGHMRSVYELYKDVPALRELMKAVCAAYRLNVKEYEDRSASSGDRSIVKYAMACPDCGELASSMINTMISAGLKM